MPLTITLRRAAEAMGVRPPTAARRLAGLPFAKLPPKGRGGREHAFAVSDVIPRLYRAEQVGAVIRAATDDHSIYVGSGPEVMDSTLRLDGCLSESARGRYAKARAQMLAGLSASRGGAGYLPLIETLNRKLLLHSEVLRWVVLGLPPLIDWTAFAPAFALVNAGSEDTLPPRRSRGTHCEPGR